MKRRQKLVFPGFLPTDPYSPVRLGLTALWKLTASRDPLSLLSRGSLAVLQPHLLSQRVHSGSRTPQGSRSGAKVPTPSMFWNCPGLLFLPANTSVPTPFSFGPCAQASKFLL